VARRHDVTMSCVWTLHGLSDDLTLTLVCLGNQTPACTLSSIRAQPRSANARCVPKSLNFASKSCRPSARTWGRPGVPALVEAHTQSTLNHYADFVAIDMPDKARSARAGRLRHISVMALRTFLAAAEPLHTRKSGIGSTGVWKCVRAVGVSTSRVQ
jgi:hypothetical protein